ncbi:hypothetical protein A8L34_00995 [Bacillus sp. FJAT-27264]|uniref:hypothetical protein n=1 Tax=Paenibacillus sp. (strain DSM 101736 / FJAT-27264) TaxID=1850362 RepID=UPI0008080BDB|nr:hypothetical protein [Bacillus sp. FJAT-27264]OBZ19510.1 hypothetical protein A8L34_00995 [Bacillus sp. FJAT-27264]
MIRKIARFSLMFVLIFVLSTQPLFAAGNTVKIKVTFVEAKLVENNHVGNEWWWGGFVNGKELNDGESVTVSANAAGSIKLHAEAQEQDKYPDDGEASASVKVSSIKTSVTKKLNVTVVENRGRYSGNTAKWQFIFKLEKVK